MLSVCASSYYGRSWDFTVNFGKHERLVCSYSVLFLLLLLWFCFFHEIAINVSLFDVNWLYYSIGNVAGFLRNVAKNLGGVLARSPQFRSTTIICLAAFEQLAILCRGLRANRQNSVADFQRVAKALAELQRDGPMDARLPLFTCVLRRTESVQPRYFWYECR